MGFLKGLKDTLFGMSDPLGNGGKKLDHPPATGEGTDSIVETTRETVSGVHETPKPQRAPSRTKNNLETSVSTKSSMSLDVLDLTRVIDIYAESRAVQAFDAEMGKERKGPFEKVKGFFARSFQRMGRDAWIDTKKREYIAEVKTGLKNGEYTEDSLREHVTSSDTGIRESAHLVHEEIAKEDALPKIIQSSVDSWMATLPDSVERKQKTAELKSAIESSYPTVTADLSQLEASLLRLERAKISSEVDTIEAKLNILDIGRIEQGNGKRKEGWFVKMADKISTGVNNLKLPDFLKQKIVGALRHPNTAAVLTALGTRAGVGAIAGATVATGFAGGFLAPILVGSVAGGLFASVRARREMRDRTAEIDRRGARGEMTGNANVDGKSSNLSHQTHTWQHPVMELYTRVTAARNSNEKEDALIAGISYLVKHRVGREKSINMLQYDADKSPSRQHVEMIRLMNQVFPGLVASFNDGSLFALENESHESKLTKELYTEITALADTTMKNRMSEEGKYAREQGLTFGLTAAVVGGSVGAAVHGLLSGTSGHFVSSGTPGSTTTHYPNNLQAYTDIKRGFWYDNATPAPKFDYTELMIHTDKVGGWNVAHMIGKFPTSTFGDIHMVEPSDFTSGNIRALVTPVKGGPSFALPIDAKGNIQIPPSMQDAFAKKSFAFLEVGEVELDATGKMSINPMGTVVGTGNMIFDTITETIPGAPGQKWVPGDVPWYGVPFGGNRYHELGKTSKKQPIGGFVDLEKDKEKPTGESAETPTAKDKDENISIVTPVPPVNTLTSPSGGESPEDVQLWDDDTEDTVGDLSKEKETLDNLWKHIVYVRGQLDGRKEGIVSLSDAQVKSHEETLDKMLEEYKRRRKTWSDRIDVQEKIVSGVKYQETIKNLISNGILATENGKPLIFHMGGRTIVAIRTENGGIIPFYRSAYGTSGKKSGKWYPCFGISEEDWIIKGTLAGMNAGHNVYEVKRYQNILNESFTWDPDLDADFVWNKERNPLVQAGGIISDDWIHREEAKQTTPKPKNHTDGLSSAWILEWLQRVIKVENIDPGKKQPEKTPTPRPSSDTSESQTPLVQEAPSKDLSQSDAFSESQVSEENENARIEQEFNAVKRILTSYTEPDDRIGQWIRVSGGGDGFILTGRQHSNKMSEILTQAQGQGSGVMRAINAYYAKGGKLWLSDKTSFGFSANYAIGLGTRESNDQDTAAIYRIADINPIPPYVNQVLNHEIGHYITMLGGNLMDDLTYRAIENLRDTQGVGLVPLSSSPFYEGKPDVYGKSAKFWEDMAELMGLYMIGRHHVLRYLEDRIAERRAAKMNISEGLKEKIMKFLDDAYKRYVG